MKVHVFYTGWIAADHKSFTTGGVQTYLLNLSRVFEEAGYNEFHYYRCSDVNNDAIIQGIYVHEIEYKKQRGKIKYVFNHFKNCIDRENDIVLFADDYLSTNAQDYHSISIQHGIFWDVPWEPRKGKFMYFLYFLDKVGVAWKRLLHIRNVKMMVCVDYNFINWFRATFPFPIIPTRVIPNFTHILEEVEKPKDRINIIFARRFEKKRGTRIFGNAIKRILEDYSNVYVTIAGWGADASWLHDELDRYPQVTFTEYKSSDSLAIHKKIHIALVPTIGSEGTSLSLLEAMSAQCAVIASDVGGITNVIINGHNGIIVPSGDEDELYHSIKYLIDNPDEQKRIAANAYTTVKDSFSYDRWKEEWKEVIKRVKQL